MLEPLFTPQTIALIGASRTPGTFAHRLLANLIDGGFPGTIVPVNPHAETILGLRCYKKIQQFAGRVDLALVAVSAVQCREVVREAMNAGARAICILATGFREAGEEGAQREEEIAEMCRSRDVRLLGPNCLGLINSGHHLFAFDVAQRPMAGGISMISQSSTIALLFLERLASAHLGVAKMVSLGNKANLSEIDLLRTLALDPQTKVIIGYLESIAAGDGFVKAAEYATNRKPVIMLKAATTMAGRKAVAAHSGEMIGQDSAYGAAFRRSGVIRADSLTALFDLTLAFTLQPLPQGNRLLVLTNAGGPGVMAVDSIERAGLTISYLTPQTSLALRQVMPEAATLYNPIDLLADADPERYRVALDAALADPLVDAVVVIWAGRGGCEAEAFARMVAAGSPRPKPVLVALLGETLGEARNFLLQAGVPAYDAPERAVVALKAMCEYVAWRNRPPRVVTRFKVHRRRVERIISRRLRTNRLHIAEVKAKDILKAYAFQVPPGHLAISVEEAIEIAEHIGYPVAMKIVSPDIVHKSDLGGVRLDIANRQAVRDGFDLMMLRVSQQAPEAWIDGIYIEKMLDRGLEVILGMHRDSQFGPMLMFGLGGIYVEVMKDVAFNLAPITFDEAMTMLTSTKSYQILVKARGEQGVDKAAMAHCLQKISQLATDFPQIAELEINPLIVGEIGTDPVVADAKINLRV
jgi:acetyltransferase